MSARFFALVVGIIIAIISARAEEVSQHPLARFKRWVRTRLNKRNDVLDQQLVDLRQVINLEQECTAVGLVASADRNTTAFVTVEALSFLCFCLLAALLAALHMMQEARSRATELTLQLKLLTMPPVAAVDTSTSQVPQNRSAAAGVAEAKAVPMIYRTAASEKQRATLVNELGGGSEREVRGRGGGEKQRATPAAPLVVKATKSSLLRMQVASLPRSPSSLARFSSKVKRRTRIYFSTRSSINTQLVFCFSTQLIFWAGHTCFSNAPPDMPCRRTSKDSFNPTGSPPMSPAAKATPPASPVARSPVPYLAPK